MNKTKFFVLRICGLIKMLAVFGTISAQAYQYPYQNSRSNLYGRYLPSAIGTENIDPYYDYARSHPAYLTATYGLQAVRYLPTGDGRLSQLQSQPIHRDHALISRLPQPSFLSYHESIMSHLAPSPYSPWEDHMSPYPLTSYINGRPMARVIHTSSTRNLHDSAVSYP